MFVFRLRVDGKGSACRLATRVCKAGRGGGVKGKLRGMPKWLSPRCPGNGRRWGRGARLDPPRKPGVRCRSPRYPSGDSRMNNSCRWLAGLATLGLVLRLLPLLAHGPCLPLFMDFDSWGYHRLAVNLLDGRYGPYLTDGETNASLPKGSSVEELTFAEALELLAARAALGPPKKKRGARSAKAAKSADGAAPKKSATKRRTSKTAAVKSSKKKSSS